MAPPKGQKGHAGHAGGRGGAARGRRPAVGTARGLKRLTAAVFKQATLDPRLKSLGVSIEAPVGPAEEPKPSAKLPQAEAPTVSSRIIVKNLPKHMTPQRFREIFSSHGEITDVKFARLPDGTFRRFGYIGYKTEKEAKAAAKYFNNTYIDTSKIAVELARPIGDGSIPRPWSKYSQGSSGFQKRQAGAQPAAPAAASEDKKKENREEVRRELDRKLRIMAELYGEDAAAKLAKDREKLDEFFEVMQPRSQSRTWANDQAAANEDQAVAQAKGGRRPGPAGKSRAEVVAVANKKPGGEGLLVTKSHVTFDDDSEGEDDEEYQDMTGSGAPDGDAGESDPEGMEDRESDGEEAGDADDVARNPAVSDMDYLRSRMKQRLDADDDEEGSADGDEASNGQEESEDELDAVHQRRSGMVPAGDGDEAMEERGEPSSPAAPPDRTERPGSAQPAAQQQHQSPADIVADTGRLFVRNLTYSCTEEDLKGLFGKFGPLSEIHIPIAKDTKQPKGFAFVLFLIPEHAVKAMVALHGSIFQGRILEVLAGQEKPQPKDAEVEREKSSYKKKLAAKRKETAKSGEAFWNSLFMNSDAVVEAMAKRLNVSKAEILDPSSENLAVRLALAETHVVGETKSFLEEEGISLDSFETNMRKERSNTVVLVKNIPFSTVEEELADAFGKFGTLGRIVLPPAKTIAVVEFLEPNEAKAAFRHLAFSKFKHLPLYLEWAPVGVFTSEYVPGAPKRKPAAAGKGPVPAEAEAEAGNADAGAAETPALSTLFVKNLNFNTTEDGMRKAFEAIGGLRSVTIATKPDPKNKGGKLSMGFGFVEFNRREDALQALKALQGFVLDGHALQLKLSNRGTSADAGASSKGRKNQNGPIEAKGTKLLVRNIPFEATKKDIQQLFASFGQLKSVRLPKKSQLAGGQHRGFAFVDFLTKQEAKNAFEALSSTHLYGRHMVIEWAEEDASIEALRQKTKKHFVGGDGADGAGATIGGRKKQKVSLGSEDEASEDD